MKKMLNQKGQNTLEIIIVSVILLGLLLTIALVMVQRNAETDRISSVQRNTLKCHAISSLITNFNSNTNYSEAKLAGLEEDVFISKSSIVIGQISCRYAGNASLETTQENFTDDSTGFTLARERTYETDPVGVIYKIKKIGGKVVFCDQTNPANTWC